MAHKMCFVWKKKRLKLGPMSEIKTMQNVLSPNSFELAPVWQYFAHVGIHCSYSFI